MNRSIIESVFVLTVVLLAAAVVLSQKAEHRPEQVEDHFPRIEVYTEIDHGDRNAGSNKHIGADGKVYYMGRQDYQPFIKRVAYLLDAKKHTEKLLNSTLEFIPEFKQKKPDITLGQYVKVDKLLNLSQRRNLFPDNMKGFLENQNDHGEFLSTIVGYRTFSPRIVEVVWIDKETWYVNNVFYSMQIGDLTSAATAVVTEEKLVAGPMKDFIGNSYVISQKIDEGFSQLNPDPASEQFKGDKVILVVGLSPGGPGSKHYHFTFYADGRIGLPGLGYHIPGYRLTHYRLAEIKNEMKKIDFAHFAKRDKPLPFVHDGQTRTIEARQNGRNYRLMFEKGGDPMPQRLEKFNDYILQIIADTPPYSNIGPRNYTEAIPLPTRKP